MIILALQLLKRMVIARSLRLRGEREPAPPAPPLEEAKPKIPAPEFTAK